MIKVPLNEAKTSKGRRVMPNLFENTRNYVLGDPELGILGDREKLAQWRHKNLGPAY